MSTDLASTAINFARQARYDVHRARRCAQYVRHPTETLSARMHPWTWQALLAEQRQWPSSERTSAFMSPVLDLPERESHWNQPATLYDVQVDSVVDRSVPPGRAAVGCSWACVVSDQGLHGDAHGHPLGWMVERGASWGGLTSGVTWIGDPHDAASFGRGLRAMRGFPFEPAYMMPPHLSVLSCTWSNAAEIQA